MKVFLSALSLLSVAQALHFFIDSSTMKCFYEELPKDTLVVGHYHAQEWNEQAGDWQQHEGISIYISVDVRYPQTLLSSLSPPPFRGLRGGKLVPWFYPSTIIDIFVTFRKFSIMTTVSSPSVALLPAASPFPLPSPATTNSASRPPPLPAVRAGSLPATTTVALSSPSIWSSARQTRLRALIRPSWRISQQG